MANILFDAALWSDGTNQPPSQWNGVQYEFLAGSRITYTGTVADGDKINCLASVPLGTLAYAAPLIVGVNGVEQQFFSSATAYDLTVTLAAGDTVYVEVMSNEPSYVGDVVLSQVIPTPCKRLQFEVQMTGDDEDA